MSEGEHVSDPCFEHVNGSQHKSQSPRQLAQIASYAKSANKEPNSAEHAELGQIIIEIIIF